MVPYGNPGSFDRPVIDGLTEPDGPARLAVFATPPCVSRSLDGGETYSAPELLLHDKLNHIMGAGTLALDGGAVLTWMTLEGSPLSPRMVARMDTLGVVQATLDSTAVWRGASILAADRWSGSKFRGTLYAIWTSVGNENVDFPDILLSSSSDSGRSWSTASIVSDAARPRFRAIPYVAVAPDGAVGRHGTRGPNKRCVAAYTFAPPTTGAGNGHRVLPWTMSIAVPKWIDGNLSVVDGLGGATMVPWRLPRTGGL